MSIQRCVCNKCKAGRVSCCDGRWLEVSERVNAKIDCRLASAWEANALEWPEERRVHSVTRDGRFVYQHTAKAIQDIRVIDTLYNTSTYVVYFHVCRLVEVRGF